MQKPLDLDLNDAVLAMARAKFPEGFDVSPSAPDTFEKLEKLFYSGKRMAVFDGASDRTIFGSAYVNYAFRAWHDYWHGFELLPFTPEGEREACALQCKDLIAAYGDNALTREWCKLLDCEINGQLAYSAKHGGNFPCDQCAFAVAYLKDSASAVERTF